MLYGVGSLESLGYWCFCYAKFEILVPAKCLKGMDIEDSVESIY